MEEKKQKKTTNPLNIQTKQKQQYKLLGFIRIQLLFFMNGGISLLGWNSLLTSLDYFKYIYRQYDVYLWFPIPLFIASGIIGVLFNIISNKFSYSTLLKIGITIINISLILLFISSVVLNNNDSIGYALSLVLCFLIGIGANLVQMSYLSMINYLGQNVISKYNIGTAFSGIAILLIRLFIISISGTSQSNLAPIIIYFIISITMNFTNLFLNLKFLTSKYYRSTVQSIKSSNKIQIVNADENLQQLSFSKIMVKTCQIISPYYIYLFFNLVITFCLYPGSLVRKQFKWDRVWSSLVLILVFNIGDLVGKIMTQDRTIFNEQSIKYLLLARLYFFLTITALANNKYQNDRLLNNNLFPFINSFLFGLTNGIILNSCFIMIFQIAPKSYKKYSGIIGGLSIQFGIMVGTILQVPYEKLIIE